jgi:hypothetical protein
LTRPNSIKLCPSIDFSTTKWLKSFSEAVAQCRRLPWVSVAP